MSRTSSSRTSRTNNRIQLWSEYRATASRLRQAYLCLAELIMFKLMLLFPAGRSRPQWISSLVLMSYVPEANEAGSAIEKVRKYA